MEGQSVPGMMRAFAALAALFLWVAPAWAQPVCPFTPSPGTSNTLCANTAFVTRSLVPKLTAATTFYVRPGGSDSNKCLVNTDGQACQTPQGALNLLLELDCNGFQVTIQLADSTSYPTVSVSNPWRGGCGANGPIIAGNASTPTNVAIAGVAVNNGASLTLQNMQIKPNGGISLALSHYPIVVYSNVDWPAASIAHISIGGGGFARAGGNYTISGGGQCHILSQGSGSTNNETSRTVTLTANVTFTEAFACAGALGAIQSIGNVYTLGAFTVTGPRFDVFNNASINTNNGGPNYYPGTTAGTLRTGGQYQ